MRWARAGQTFPQSSGWSRGQLVSLPPGHRWASGGHPQSNPPPSLLIGARIPYNTALVDGKTLFSSTPPPPPTHTPLLPSATAKLVLWGHRYTTESAPQTARGRGAKAKAPPAPAQPPPFFRERVAAAPAPARGTPRVACSRPGRHRAPPLPLAPPVLSLQEEFDQLFSRFCSVPIDKPPADVPSLSSHLPAKVREPGGSG